MVLVVKLQVLNSGVFVLLIPNAVANPVPYVIGLVAGTDVSTLALFVAKRPLPLTS